MLSVRPSFLYLWSYIGTGIFRDVEVARFEKQRIRQDQLIINIVERWCEMKQYKVLVCGTNFGKFYLSALLKGNSCFCLDGIFAKGSKRSRMIADELDVNLYTSIDKIPASIDIACVVVKSTILGGQGTGLSAELLKRGINVIQEHPVHSADIGQCFKTAQDNGVNYHINSHFVHVKPVKIFIDYVAKTVKYERPLFVDVSTSLIYSTIDIIGQALGKIEPFEFCSPTEWTDSATSAMETDILPFKCLQGVIGGVPVTFKLQNYFDPDDLDQNYLIMHRISIGSESGNTTLLSSHGPVVWTQGYPVPARNSENHTNAEQDDVSYGHHKTKYIDYSQPTSVIFSENKGPSYSKVAYHYWPDAILSELNVMKHQIETGLNAKWQSEGYLKNVGEIWLELMKRFGRPNFVKINELNSSIPDPSEFFNFVRRHCREEPQ